MTSPQTFPNRRWIYPAILAGLIVVASSRSVVAGPDINNFDKVVHFSIYGLLGTLVLRALGGRRWAVAVAMVSLFGVSDELHQHFTPGRSMDAADWLADTLGAALAVTLYINWKWYRETLERRVAGGGSS